MKSTERENRHQNLEDNESVSSAAGVAERGMVLKVRGTDCFRRGFYWLH